MEFPLQCDWNAKMLEIAGGVLLAVAALVVLVATARYIFVALSAVLCLAIIAGAWMLISSEIGDWWAAIMLVCGLGIWFYANRNPSIEKPGPVSIDQFARASRQRRLANGEPPAAWVLEAWETRKRIARWTRLTPDQKREYDDPAWWAD